jgi:excinuclease ABC subunit C
VRLFDRKFGARFLDEVPAAPGVYRFHDAAGVLFYVGKAANLRRRLGQYRLTGRRKKERKRRALLKAAARITWEVCESPLAAALTEIRLIQTLRPPQNVASAFPFLYPYVGVATEGGETYFCLTTRARGASRPSRSTAPSAPAGDRQAFFRLMDLLRYVGHGAAPSLPPPRRGPALHVRGFRRLPADSAEAWGALLRGASREALETLALRLVDHAGARAAGRRRTASGRSAASSGTRPARWPGAGRHRLRALSLPQQERDLLFARYRVEALEVTALVRR